MPKIDTTAQSEGAEIFTVAELLSRGLVAGSYPRNYPDVDVYAFDKTIKKIINVQVKYVHSAKSSTIPQQFRARTTSIKNQGLI